MVTLNSEFQQRGVGRPVVGGCRPGRTARCQCIVLAVPWICGVVEFHVGLVLVGEVLYERCEQLLFARVVLIDQRTALLELIGDFSKGETGVPVLFGEHDAGREAGFQRKWEVLYPEARSEVVRAANHFPMADASHRVAETIADWRTETV